MRRLIINADDMGADRARNEGIFEAIDAGIVTSASLLPNGPALQHALEGIRSLGSGRLSLAVHLNLSEGRPLAAGLSRLAGPDGQFLGKAAVHRLLMTDNDPSIESDIARESALQIVRLLDAGVDITHIDGHQHVHVFPAALRAVMETAKGFGIRRMRVPDETLLPGDSDVERAMLEEANRFAALGRSARRQLAAASMVSSDHFRGLALKGRIDLQGLLRLLETLPDGTTELMVHPGRAPSDSPFSAFSSADRQLELEALLDPRFRVALDEAAVVLTTFREVGG